MKLSQASISVRKAAALRGVKDGNIKVVPFFDHANAGTWKEIKVKIGNISITTGEMAYADHLTWKEIKSR